MTFILSRHASAQAFLDAAQEWLMRAEAENNLVLGIAGSLAQNPSASKERPYLATVGAPGGIAGCAIRSPPYPLAITRCSDSTALGLIADDVIAEYPDLRQVSGPEPTIAVFGKLWAASNGRTSRHRRAMRMYEMRRPPARVAEPPGFLRAIAEPDLDGVTAWLTTFVSELGVNEPGEPAQIARARLAARSLCVWDDGGAVSMAGFGGKTPNGVRVNLVYTPPAQRRRGYASACVAALTRLLLEQGNSYCALYADLANPTSNAIYQRIGYQPVCDASEYELG